MIPTGDLRIGNLVSNQTGDLNGTPTGDPVVITIEGLRWAHLYLLIPLTAEWLENFGFVKDGYPDYRGPEGFCIAICNDIFYHYVEVSDDYYSFLSTEIKSVHHLQNLFYSIHNTELTLKSI